MSVCSQNFLSVIRRLHWYKRKMQSSATVWTNTKGLKGPGIPPPPGPFAVGCVDLAFRLQGDQRGSLMVRLHYPTAAKPEDGFTYADWYPHKRYIQGFFEFQKRKFNPIVFTKITSPKVPALEGAPLISADVMATLPAVVFCHGLGGMRTTNSAVCCDLSSHGLLVASVEHRDESACASHQRVPVVDGAEGEFQDHWICYRHLKEGEREFHLRNEQIQVRVGDAGKALDILCLLNEGKEVQNMMGGNFHFGQFKGRLDVDKAAVMGHSFGGGTTVLSLVQDERFKCGLALDCWMFPIHQDFYKGGPSVCAPRPLYFINSHNFQWEENVRRMMLLTTPPNSAGQTTCRVMTIRGTHHFNQCDMPFVAESALQHMGVGKSELDSTIANKVNTDICWSFLRRYLLKDPASQGDIPNLDGTDGHSEHIMFGTNLDISKDTDSKL